MRIRKNSTSCFLIDKEKKKLNSEIFLAEDKELGIASTALYAMFFAVQ